MTEITTIDISDLHQAGSSKANAVARGLAKECREIGFVGVRGHGIPSALLAQLRSLIEQLFALPIGEKLALQVQQTNYRGYIPLGFFSPNAAGELAHSTQLDQYEGYKLHFEVAAQNEICRQSDLYGPNRWPTQLPALKIAVLEYWRHCDRVAAQILDALLAELDLADKVLLGAFDQPLSNMTLLHYPPKLNSTGGFGIHPHKDTDVLTLLVPDQVGGLLVRPRGSPDWIRAAVPNDSLLVNVGDMLETWSAGYYQSTPHKVINNSGKQRYSFPYFMVPRYDVPIHPWPQVAGCEFFASATAGEISRDIWRSNWPNAQAISSDYDPYTH